MQPHLPLARFARVAVALLLSACAQKPAQAPPAFITQQSTGIEYAVLRLEDFSVSGVQMSRRFRNADAPPPEIPGRHIAVFTQFAHCASFTQAVRTFLQTTGGGGIGAMSRSDPRGDGRLGFLADANAGLGVFAFRTAGVSESMALREQARCEAYQADHPGLMLPVFAILVRVEDSQSTAAYYDRYVEGVVFAESHGNFGEQALQEFLVGLIF